MLNHKQCDAFLAVAETGSFDLAAEKLYITPSAVTLRVQSLEKNLGHLLILRERPCRVTTAGQTLLHYLQHSRLLEQNFLQELTGHMAHSNFYQLNIASNDDSLNTWLLSSIQDVLIKEKITVHFKVDDQTHTHHLLETGLVNACISTEVTAMKGCLAKPLGNMTYRMVANAAFVKNWFPNGVNRENLKLAPAVIYNDKDQLHNDVMLKYFGLTQHSYPHHYIPSSTAFAEAISLGLGFGMLPEYQIGVGLKTGEMIDLLPDLHTKIHLYWHHWKQQSAPLDSLTQALIQHAQHFMNRPF